MKLIIVLLACLVIFGLFLLGCDQVDGVDDNPIVVVGDVAYINVPVDGGVTLSGSACSLLIWADVDYDDYTIKYEHYSRDEIKKIVIYFGDCPPFVVED